MSALVSNLRSLSHLYPVLFYSGFNGKPEDSKEKAEEMMNKAGNVAEKTKDAVANAAAGNMMWYTLLGAACSYRFMLLSA